MKQMSEKIINNFEYSQDIDNNSNIFGEIETSFFDHAKKYLSQLIN